MTITSPTSTLGQLEAAILTDVIAQFASLDKVEGAGWVNYADDIRSIGLADGS
jgi:hypothetical protein